jgi:hypothetical protein
MVNDAGRTVVQSAHDHGLSWPLVAAGVTAHAIAVLAAWPGPVEVLAIDEIRRGAGGATPAAGIRIRFARATPARLHRHDMADRTISHRILVRLTAPGRDPVEPIDNRLCRTDGLPLCRPGPARPGPRDERGVGQMDLTDGPRDPG